MPSIRSPAPPGPQVRQTAADQTGDTEPTLRRGSGEPALRDAGTAVASADSSTRSGNASSSTQAGASSPTVPDVVGQAPAAATSSWATAAGARQGTQCGHGHPGRVAGSRPRRPGRPCRRPRVRRPAHAPATQQRDLLLTGQSAPGRRPRHRSPSPRRCQRGTCGTRRAPRAHRAARSPRRPRALGAASRSVAIVYGVAQT